MDVAVHAARLTVDPEGPQPSPDREAFARTALDSSEKPHRANPNQALTEKRLLPPQVSLVAMTTRSSVPHTKGRRCPRVKPDRLILKVFVFLLVRANSHRLPGSWGPGWDITPTSSGQTFTPLSPALSSPFPSWVFWFLAGCLTLL